jgi:DNA-binding transcriptional ArsR family regulator
LRRRPRRTSPERVEAIRTLRRLRLTAAEIAEPLDMALSTVSRWLMRIGLGKRSRLSPPEPPNRYQRARPGELVHVDVKKLGRFRQPGHRVLGRGRPGRVTQTTAKGSGRGVVGWDFLHVCVDDATRLAYRSLKQLEAQGLVRQQGMETGERGPARTPVGSTRAGTRAVDRWIATPVEHVRDFRHELLLKLAFLSRRRESADPLLGAQLMQFRPIIEGLAASRRGTNGLDRLVLDWRIESARAAERFVKRLAAATDR